MANTAVQIPRSEMMAMVWASRIVYWQTQLNVYMDDNFMGGAILSALAHAALESAVTGLIDTGIKPSQLHDIVQRIETSLTNGG